MFCSELQTNNSLEIILILIAVPVRARACVRTMDSSNPYTLRPRVVPPKKKVVAKRSGGERGGGGNGAVRGRGMGVGGWGWGGISSQRSLTKMGRLKINRIG